MHRSDTSSHPALDEKLAEQVRDAPRKVFIRVEGRGEGEPRLLRDGQGRRLLHESFDGLKGLLYRPRVPCRR
jgi:hypothetical protein